MILEEPRAKELIQKPQNRVKIDSAIAYEKRIRLHNINHVNKSDLPEAYGEFKAWISSFLTKDKADRFEQFFRPPSPTVELTEGIFSEYNKVFHTNNSFKKERFIDDNAEIEFAKRYNDLYTGYFEVKGMETLRVAPSSVLVIDFRFSEEIQDMEPFSHFVPVDNFIDIEVNDDNDAEYFIFRSINYKRTIDGVETIHKTVAVVLDDSFYRVYDISKGEPVLIIENPHDFGETPARSFWTDNLNPKNNIAKKSPLAGSLSPLDYLLFREVSKEYAETYAAYPIIVGTEQKCSYQDDAGNFCNDGRVSHTTYTTDAQWNEIPKDVVTACPQCATRQFLGPGTSLTVPAPTDEFPEIKSPAIFVAIDPKTLKYLEEDIDRRKEIIWNNTVGSSADIISKQAVNTDQVSMTAESQRTVLNKIKRNFELIEKWQRKMIAKGMFGERFLDNTVDYGTEYFLKTVSDLQEDLKAAMDSGATEADIKNIREQIILTKFDNNPAMRDRMIMMMNLEPLNNVDRKTVIEMRGKGHISKEDFTGKLYFNDFITQFERENTKIEDFGTLLSFDSRINKIKETINKYRDDKINENKPDPIKGESGTHHIPPRDNGE